jgi:hypothetical protein
MALEEAGIVFEHSRATAGERLLLLELAMLCPPGSSVCTASIAQLCRLCGYSERATVRHLQGLEAFGELQVARHSGAHQVSQYQLLIVSKWHHLATAKGVKMAPLEPQGGAEVPKWHHSQAQKGAILTPLEPLSLSILNTSTNREDELRERERRNGAKLTPPPEALEVTPQMVEWCTKHCPLVEVEPDTEQWLDAMRAKGYERADWSAEWRTGMRQAQKRHQERSQSGGQARGPQELTTASPGLSGSSNGAGHPVNGSGGHTAANQAAIDVMRLGREAAQRAEELKRQREGGGKRI